MANKVEANVAKMVEELKKNPSARFSKSDFQGLVYAILADKDFDTKKYVIKNDEMIEMQTSMNAAMVKFMDKLLKHAQMNDPAERARLIESFEFGPRDIEWITDAVDEAMYQYSECGKNMRVFRDKMLQLSLKKITRSGKSAGKITYKKSVVDRAVALQKRNATK